MRKLLIGSVSLILFHCFGSGASEGGPSAEAVHFVTIGRGVSSGITEQPFVTIRTSDEWLDLWRRHSATTVSSLAAPAIDFAREMVIALFLGQRSTGGFAIEVVRVERVGGGVRVVYRETPPPRGGMVPQILTQPYHIIKLQRSDEEVVFERQRK